MYNLFLALYESMGFSNPHIITLITTAVSALLLGLAARLLVNLVLSFILKKARRLKGREWPDILLRDNLPRALANLAVPAVLGGIFQALPSQNWLLDKLSSLIGLLVTLLLLNALIHTLTDLYNLHDISKTKPITGIIQVIQVVYYVVLGIVTVAVLLDKSPIALLGGIGAAAAVLSFVFQDPILGFVAGIQLTANNMIQIGDWIEMPKYTADGNLIEISMTTIKVQNFDNSISNIPAKALVNDAFVNWRGMTDAGGRRIKRAIFINPKSVRLCDPQLLARFEDVSLIADYMHSKEKEIASDSGSLPKNEAAENTAAEDINARQLTNLGTFRAYMTEYLKSCPELRKDLDIVVRQLPYEARGIPLEVYAFTATTDWEKFESVQSDLFDHFYSVIPLFDLSI